MNNKDIQQIKLFESSQIRTIWDEQIEEYFFVVVDVVATLTESSNPTDYIKKMRKRDEELGKGWGQIVTPLSVPTTGGIQKLNCADTKGILRIIQSIPSPKAEPFKQWLAQIGKERIDQMQDPELSIKQALADYKRLGYSDNWINQRLKSIEIRKDLTDEWKRGGVSQNFQYATLTDIIYKTWANKTAKEYRKFKGLKKENLRDNMTNKELVINMLAELSTTEISKSRNPENMDEHKRIAKEGGQIAKNARVQLEKKTGKKVVTSLNAKNGIIKIKG
ncbi:MAG: Bro-N domain-containing protein [Fibrobacter sp.]|nr:Bro-N domain-containing protein [Fibrobacter sp.]